jgi:chloramphenicol-sensitive protein RarD
MGLYFQEIPAVALILAFTFGVYGLLRKTMPVDSISGLMLETSLIAPFALIYIIYLNYIGALSFLHTNTLTNILLASAGLISALPLIIFVKATRILTYATIGVLMYVWPTMVFIIAIFVFEEPFNLIQLIGFIFIWVSLGLYTWHLIIREKRS